MTMQSINRNQSQLIQEHIKYIINIMNMYCKTHDYWMIKYS